MTDEQLIRAAVLDVIDEGNPRRKIGNKNFGWNLYAGDDDYVNACRLDFTDAIIARIRQLRQMEETK